MTHEEDLGGFKMIDAIQHRITQTWMYKIMSYMMTSYGREMTEVYGSVQQDWG